jgi:hypothetical protein
MKIHVTATVVYPVYINQEFDVKNPDDLREAILKQADKSFEAGGIKPLITECSEDELID